MRFASVSSGQSSVKRGRTWPVKARAASMAEGKKGRLMLGSIESGFGSSGHADAPGYRALQGRLQWTIAGR